MSEQSIPAARDLVGRVLEDIPERQHHCAGVAARAQTLAVTVPQAAAAELVAAAWLHDIGYGSLLRDTGFHPIDGVAHVRGLDDRMREFEFVEDPLSDALTVADNTAGPGSTVMTVEERLSEKLKRHGRNSWTGRANPERDDYIHAAARRVAQRLAAVGQRDPGLAGAFLLRDQRANGRCTHGEVAASPPNNRPVFARRSSILRVRQTSGAPRSE
jgi:hypothetical protein